MLGIVTGNASGVHALANVDLGLPGLQGNAVVINLNGAALTGNQTGVFAGSNGLSESIRAGTDLALAFTLLHEFAHVGGPNAFVNKDASTDSQRFNNNMIVDNCRRALAGFSNK